MSYQVLARKWRPQSFSQLVGQEHVVKALTNALDNDRLHHAYLFTGTRGVGKTTLARIFAKSLNCEQGVSSTPCGVCSACREIDEGRFVDLLEVDAASRTKVDQTRELLENVPYAPVRGRYKVYLIDEVHMFSSSSFNALLKTLEEPPPHVKFILATTDPQKMPVTVLSRCLQFNLKRLSREQIEGQLRRILGEEQIPFEEEALALLARGADGSMRDGLSLLDQAIAFAGGEVGGQEVRAMLGAIEGGPVQGLLEALAEGDGAGLLQQVDAMAEAAPDFSSALADLLALLHQLALQQLVPGYVPDEAYAPEHITELARRLAPEDVQLFYQIGVKGQQELPLAPDPRSGFEMVLLRMLAFRPAGAAEGPSSTGSPKNNIIEKQVVEGDIEGDGSAPGGAVAGVSSGPDPSHWEAFAAALQLGGIASQLANNCVFHAWDGETLRLRLDPARQQLRVGQSERRLLEGVRRLLGAQARLQIEIDQQVPETPARRQDRQRQERQRAAEEVMANDPLVRELGEQFDARLVPGSVKPLG